jgi:predicted PurR-regulated permease PerM
VIETDTGFLWSVALVLMVYAVAQMTQDWFLTPRILGKATGLRPVAILLSVFIWGKLLGFLGLLLSIPLTCLAIAYYRRYVLTVAPQRIITPTDNLQPKEAGT